MTDRPIRIQLRRTKGWKMPPNTRVVTRSTIFGNPWACGSREAFWWPQDPKGPRWISTHHIPRLILTQHEAVAIFRGWMLAAYVPSNALPDGLTDAGMVACRAALVARRGTILASLTALRGKNLACVCPLDAPCHADVLLELANAHTDQAPADAVPEFQRFNYEPQPKYEGIEK